MVGKFLPVTCKSEGVGNAIVPATAPPRGANGALAEACIRLLGLRRSPAKSVGCTNGCAGAGENGCAGAGENGCAAAGENGCAAATENGCAAAAENGCAAAGENGCAWTTWYIGYCAGCGRPAKLLCAGC